MAVHLPQSTLPCSLSFNSTQKKVKESTQEPISLSLSLSTSLFTSAMAGTFVGLIAAAATFFMVSLVFGVILVICSESKRRRTRKAPAGNRGQTRSHSVRNLELSSVAVGESASFDLSLSRISMAELLQATRNFSPDLVIGDGSFGLVYKAKLSSGVTVAAKKLSADAFQGFREFRAEMETLGNINHRNIVKILGYYAMNSDRILVYEFIERGSLDQWLHELTPLPPEDDDVDSPELIHTTPLSWETRVKIIRGVAAGLCYMHNLEKPIIHRDIKASNVLLDSNFEPHIADFGLARRIEGSQAHVSTQVAGTMGYMPPEYLNGATMATAVGDVYSFGILMLEVATARRPNLRHRAAVGDKETGLVEWVRQMMELNRLMEMLDPTIPAAELNGNAVAEYFRVATLCAGEMCKLRPAMTEAVVLLDEIQ